MADLVIRISGDITDYEKALEDAQGETEAFSGQLESVAKSAGVAFALLAAEAVASVTAFAASQAASNKLISTLQQQGIYTKELVEDYKDIASAIQQKTGADDDEVVAAMASAQNMLGQTKITKDLAFAVSDLAEAKGIDLKAAYDLVGKAATINTGILKRYGVEVKDTGDKTKNLELITQGLNATYGGQAEAAAKGLGGIKLLKNTFGDLQEEIGKRLAPAFEILISKITGMLQFVQANKGLVDFIVAAGTGAAVVSGLALAVGLGGIAFLKLKAAMAAAQIATSAMTLATRGLVAATGIGALVTVATLVALNWDDVWPRVKAVFLSSMTAVVEAATGVGKVLKGLLTLDVAKFEEGEQQFLNAAKKASEKYNQVLEEGKTSQAAIEAAAEKDKLDKNNENASKEEELERQKNARMQTIAAEKRALMVAQLAKNSEEGIKLQQEEIALLEAMEDEKNEAILGKLQERLLRVRELQAQQAATELEEKRIFNEQILAGNAEFEALSDEQKALFLEKNQQSLQAELLTENQARQQAALERARIQVKEHNDFLINQQKFGAAYATITKTINSEQFQAANQLASGLIQLQSSSNSTLKSVGKAAALADIAIKTGQGALAAYAQSIAFFGPLVGPVIGTGLAGAVIAFGAEQAGKVTGAADGGLLTGGIPGKDSIPLMAMPGELVAPTRNFDEVVNAVADSRLAAAGLGGGIGGGTSGATIVLQLKDDLMDFIEAKLTERSNLNLSLQGT